MITSPYIHDVVLDIVKGFRISGNIIAVGINDTKYHLTVDVDISTMRNNDIIVIDNVEYRAYGVGELTADSFYINAASGLEFGGKTFALLQPFYIHEEEPKANEVLTQAKTFKRYPLILLLHPYTVDKSTFGYDIVNNLRIAIVAPTKQEYNSIERYSNVIKPILDPIYKNLIDGMLNDERLSFDSEHVGHERTDNLLIDGNPLPDKLDGILLEFEPIKINYENC